MTNVQLDTAPTSPRGKDAPPFSQTMMRVRLHNLQEVAARAADMATDTDPTLAPLHHPPEHLLHTQMEVPVLLRKITIAPRRLTPGDNTVSVKRKVAILL